MAIDSRDDHGQPHYVVAGKDYVSIIAVNDRDEILLVRQFRPAIGAESLELPAGHVEVDQTPAQAAEQELLEETCHTAESFELLGTLNPDTGRLTNRHWCFIAHGIKRDPSATVDGEIAEAISMPLADLHPLILDGRFNHAQHLAAIGLALLQNKLRFPAPSPESPSPLVAHTPQNAATRWDRPATSARFSAVRPFRSSEGTAADVCVVGGAGHVGLPLSLVLASLGMRVTIYDRDQTAIDKISRGKMPFTENGAQPLLDSALAHDRLRLTTNPQAMTEAPNMIVTIGTPVDEFLNPDVGVVRRWVKEVAPLLHDGQLIMLRSTLYPGTTSWLDEEFRRHGKNPKIAFCPERIVQGQSIRELPELPQIVGGVTPAAESAAAAFWSFVTPNIVRLAPLEAEFAKLICNAYRYIQFAAANQMFMITTEAGVDFGRVVRGLKENYGRMRDFPTAGFAAGPCLLKDSMQLAAFAQNRFSLGYAAMQVNEGLVLWLVDELARKFAFSRMTVGLLGMAFKAEVDDTRASLSYKLKKSLTLRCREVLTTDPHVTSDTELLPLAEVVERSDLLILCAPHAAYRDIRLEGKALIDIWGMLSPRSGL